MKTVIASTVAPLDSNVITGGGTDVTDLLQAVLDTAPENGGIRLIMDGAALVRGLKLHSDTTIECLSLSCGFFQAPGSNRAIVTNYHWNFYENKTHNIRLTGGTYNQDCKNQSHDTVIPQDVGMECVYGSNNWCVFAMEFYGVKYLTVNDLNIRNFRTYAFMVGGFENVTVENVWLELPDRMHAQNQDGFHFWGPGKYLTIKNVGGCVGDDFMNIGPDENDCRSSITDVIVDGVYLDDADQGIRLLSRGTGRLDRVTIKNISGYYRSFGFYVNCWFPDKTYGDFGNIVFENIDLRTVAPNYDYRPPMLFSVGGNVECMTFRNIRSHNPSDARCLFELGLPFYDTSWKFPEDNKPKLGTFIFDSLTLIEDGSCEDGADIIKVFADIDRIIISDLTVIRSPEDKNPGNIITMLRESKLGHLYIRDAVLANVPAIIDRSDLIGSIHTSNVVFE